MNVLKRIGIILVSLVIVAVVRHYWQERSAKSSADKELDSYSVGECVTMAKSDEGVGNVELTKADCGTDPSYTVASRIGADEKCPSEHYSEYSLSVNYETTGKLCLVENLVVGHCYESEFMTNITKLNADCRGGLSSSNPFRVVDRSETADAPCPADSTAVSFADPARTYCLAPLETI
ncbi:hypothetical protein [Mycolicibacterium brumae]|uniref:Pyridine nucleotide-disulfide oxidoreductase n=1 Tax=Mycolicibacterium brumae TaxID=85968 RepID=A0A2G5PAS1_9MYCO|nr:hypothetical protein [Mycolicibacterium brumae]MCV7193037.1 hypothetical protein [Mycolicibacterium brumae]PIB75357.1 hypothetical protein CQY22_009425 [Mycolicibacterium brumae]RWA22038.1 hypothetical protein MBRU_13720 [Mycolicibacterium brumae DSM 44177]UWW07961.1 hypothetical protein L2Z93_000997 [Mycolicibacterium brumae]